MVHYDFKEDKASQLSQWPSLRFSNWVGMIRWKEGYDGKANPLVRLLNPVSWIFLIVVFFIVAFLEGFPSSWKGMREFIRDETVWL
jgi:hypothetical protein